MDPTQENVRRVLLGRGLLDGRVILVERLEFDVVLEEQALVAMEAVQQLSFRKPAATLARR